MLNVDFSYYKELGQKITAVENRFFNEWIMSFINYTDEVARILQEVPEENRDIVAKSVVRILESDIEGYGEGLAQIMRKTLTRNEVTKS